MIVVKGGDCVEAWQNAVKTICTGGTGIFNLFIEIENPTAFPQQWLIDYNPQSVGRDNDNISNVINTVFPYRLWSRCQNRNEFYRRFKEINARSMTRSRYRSAWGTYFQRMVDFRNDEGTNQLETAIEKLQSWNVRSKTGLVFHLSSPEIDKPRTRGAPCWHFGELLWKPDDLIDFVVVYRNHDYFNKALGNFIALGQLLNFICTQSGKTPGSLICHSVHAYSGATKGKVLQLANLPV